MDKKNDKTANWRVSFDSEEAPVSSGTMPLPFILRGLKSSWLTTTSACSVSVVNMRQTARSGLRWRYSAPRFFFTAAPLFVQLGRHTGCEKRAVSLTLSVPHRPPAYVCGRVTGRLTTSIVVSLKLRHSAIRAARRESPVSANCKKPVRHCASERNKKSAQKKY